MKLPLWFFRLTIGRVLAKKTADDDSDFEEDELIAGESDSSSGPGKHTPDSDDFELLDKSVDDISGAAKTTGSQPQSSKNNKRKSKGKKK